MFFFCPFDDVDQIPRAVAPRDPNLFLSTPAQALQALFSTDPPPGWGTGIPLVMRGADVDVVVTDGVAQVTVDYDFEAAPINNFSTSAMVASPTAISSRRPCSSSRRSRPSTSTPSAAASGAGW